MSDILSITGIIISVIGVIISLIFFNASIDNSRKILLSKILYFIRYDHEIMSLFNNATKNKRNTSLPLTRENVLKFNSSMFRLEEMLKEINYKNDYGVPIIGESDEAIENDKRKHTYHLDKTYSIMSEYFKKRNLPDFELLLNEWDDRLYFIQHYKEKYKYKRKFFIGPIIGLKIIYKRQHKFATYANSHIKLIKTIKNISDFEKYYNQCYSNFNIFQFEEKQDFKREIKNLVIITDKDHQIPITIYR